MTLPLNFTPVATREHLLGLLAEASEIEHNLMCCYLYAVFSLKQGTDEGLSADELAAVQRWRRVILDVAIEEMGHLTMVSNIMVALGGSPHFGRQNFPIAAGYHPSGIVVKLAPFNAATLDHFIYLERPEGVEDCRRRRVRSADSLCAQATARPGDAKRAGLRDRRAALCRNCRGADPAVKRDGRRGAVLRRSGTPNRSGVGPDRRRGACRLLENGARGH